MGDPASPLVAGLDEESLRLRLKGTEYDFVERKSKTDKGIGFRLLSPSPTLRRLDGPRSAFFGATDQGKPQLRYEELKKIVRSVSDVIERAFPAIYRHVVPIQIDRAWCLAVII